MRQAHTISRSSALPSAAIAIVAALMLTGCNGDAGSGVTPPANPTPLPTANQLIDTNSNQSSTGESLER